MRFLLLFITIFLTVKSYSQSLQALNNRRELLVKITPYGDSTLIVNVAGIKTNGYLCYGNTLEIAEETISEKADTITINLLPPADSIQNVAVNENKTLKFKILKNQHVRFSSEQIVVVLLFVDGVEQRIISRYRIEKFCHRRLFMLDPNPYYIKI